MSATNAISGAGKITNSDGKEVTAVRAVDEDSTPAPVGKTGDPTVVQLEDSGGTEIGTAANPVEVGLRNSAGTEIGTAADPVAVGLFNAAGTEIGTSADPVEVGLRSSGGTELGTAADPVQVGLVNGAGTEIGTAADPVEVGLRDSGGTELGTTGNPLFTSATSASVTLTKIADVAMTLADTQYSVVLPAGAKGVVLKLASTGAAWRLSPDAGEVAAGTGTQLAAGQAALIDGPLAGQTVYFAAGVAGQTMTILHE